VNQAAFYPGAPAGAWLENPRLVLHVSQAKKDVISWFDSNYPGGASGGVGSGNSASNSSYGTLMGEGSAVGNISGMDSIDGQFWPIYDYVDNSILLYFSIKTPNLNTKSIYAYKIRDTEMTSPLSSSQFLGGVSGIQYSNTTSSHRFVIVSPDPLVSFARVPGRQSAVFAYAFGVFDFSTPDHAIGLGGGYIPDIHGQPLNWGQSGVIVVPPNGLGLDMGGLNNVDKLGSIVPVGDTYSASSYCVLFNATSIRDSRLGSNSVVIDAMQVRCAFLHLNAITPHLVYGYEPLIELTGVESLGHCRPQYSTLPDGLPKIVYNDFQFDQSLRTVYEYVDSSKLRPENHRRLIYTNDLTPNPFLVKTYGKKKALIMLSQGNQPTTNNPQNQPTFIEVSGVYGNMDASTGYYFGTVFNEGTLYLLGQLPQYSLDGAQNSGTTTPVVALFEIEDLAPYIRIKGYGNQTFNYALVELRDE
jgi:hypothetical protein